MADLDERPGEVAIDTSAGEAGEAMLTVSGEVDSANAGELAAAVDALLAKGSQALVFELSGLRFIDSAGIAVLVRAAAHVEVVHLRNPSSIVRRTIEATGLAGVLRMQP